MLHLINNFDFIYIIRFNVLNIIFNRNIIGYYPKVIITYYGHVYSGYDSCKALRERKRQGMRALYNLTFCMQPTEAVEKLGEQSQHGMCFFYSKPPWKTFLISHHLTESLEANSRKKTHFCVTRDKKLFRSEYVYKKRGSELIMRIVISENDRRDKTYIASSCRQTSIFLQTTA